MRFQGRFVVGSLLALSLVGFGCNQKKASSDDGLITAKFIDAPVRGIGFTRSNGATGTTSPEGVFRCSRGELVKFDIAGVFIGEAPCGDVTFVQDLIAEYEDYTWGRAASIIQTIADPIEEEDEVVELDVTDATAVMLEQIAAEVISWTKEIFTGTDAEFETKMTTVLTQLKEVAPEGHPIHDRSVVSIADAQSYANEFLATYYEDNKEAMLGDLATVLEASAGNEAFSFKVDMPEGDEDCSDCWLKYLLTAQITSESGRLYISTVGMTGYNEDEDLSEEGVCSSESQSDGNCVNVARSHLPAKKLITENPMTLVSKVPSTDPEGFTVRKFTFTFAKDGDDLALTGSYEETVTSTDGTIIRSRSANLNLDERIDAQEDVGSSEVNGADYMMTLLAGTSDSTVTTVVGNAEEVRIVRIDDMAYDLARDRLVIATLGDQNGEVTNWSELYSLSLSGENRQYAYIDGSSPGVFGINSIAISGDTIYTSGRRASTAVSDTGIAAFNAATNTYEVFHEGQGYHGAITVVGDHVYAIRAGYGQDSNSSDEGKVWKFAIAGSNKGVKVLVGESEDGRSAATAISVTSDESVVYFADADREARNNPTRIMKIVAGTASVHAGQEESGFVDGTGAEAAFHYIVGMDIDSSGNLFVVDSFREGSAAPVWQLRKVTPEGVVTTLFAFDQEPAKTEFNYAAFSGFVLGGEGEAFLAAAKDGNHRIFRIRY